MGVKPSTRRPSIPVASPYPQLRRLSSTQLQGRSALRPLALKNRHKLPHRAPSMNANRRNAIVSRMKNWTAKLRRAGNWPKKRNGNGKKKRNEYARKKRIELSGNASNENRWNASSGRQKNSKSGSLVWRQVCLRVPLLPNSPHLPSEWVLVSQAITVFLASQARFQGLRRRCQALHGSQRAIPCC